MASHYFSILSINIERNYVLHESILSSYVDVKQLYCLIIIRINHYEKSIGLEEMQEYCLHIYTAFDCINYDLIAKQDAYGFDKITLNYI